MNNRRVRTAWLFLAPMLLLMAVVAVWPLLRSVWFAFTDANLNDLRAPASSASRTIWVYVDGEWYGVLAEGLWWNAVRNTLQFAVDLGDPGDPGSAWAWPWC